MFDGVAKRLVDAGVVSSFSGFLWGTDQLPSISPERYESLLLFSRDVRPKLDAEPNLEVLREKEQTYDISLNRLLYSDRHLLEGRTFEGRLRLLEVLFRTIEAAYDEQRPDFILSEDVSCLTSYVHWVVAKHRGIPFLSVAQGILRGTVAIHSSEMQHIGAVEEAFAELRQRSLTPEERDDAAAWLEEFERSPRRPSGASMFDRLPVVNVNDIKRVVLQAKRFGQEQHNPTIYSPGWAVKRRAKRLINQQTTKHLFEAPVDGERYFLFPIHYQPEASTLVRGLYYLDQPALIDDIAKSLPVGTRLYVKEHYTNRGRQSPDFYHRIRASHGVRLLGPDTNAWDLIQGADAVITITSRMGWEGVLAGKPVFTFGETFYNCIPLVTHLGSRTKDDWWRVIGETLDSFEPDRELVLRYIAALQAALHPGFKGNPQTFPWVMEPENLDKLSAAVTSVLRRGNQ